ncbi:hypothetical protein RB195_010040 [Necator americanus]|uniref:Uncharacterized protein n=1 Tax=Necator americanus TaxID=51031 RepID=A0ABR1CW29_NECAM
MGGLARSGAAETAVGIEMGPWRTAEMGGGEDLGAIGPSSSQPEWRSHHDSDRLRNYTTCQDVQIRLYIETK